MEKHLKRWQGWLLFGGSMVVVFLFRSRSVLPFGTSRRGSKHLQQQEKHV